MEKIKHYPMIHPSTDIDLPSITSNDKVTIITSFSDRDKAILINQLEENSVDYINAAEDIETFIKAYKPTYYYNALKNVNTEYVLILDSYDSIINDLNGIQDLIEPYNKKVIYGSWNTHFPTYFDVDFNVPEDNNKKYLNSGVVIGKTSDVKAYYKALSEYVEKEYPESDFWLKDYEQYWIYKFLSENLEYVDTIGIDYNEDIVKNLTFENGSRFDQPKS